MILALKIFGGIIGCLVIAFFMWFLWLVAIEVIFGTDRCKNCPMKNECFNAIAAGMPTLCNNSEPLHTQQL